MTKAPIDRLKKVRRSEGELNGFRSDLDRREARIKKGDSSRGRITLSSAARNLPLARSAACA